MHTILIIVFVFVCTGCLALGMNDLDKKLDRIIKLLEREPK